MGRGSSKRKRIEADVERAQARGRRGLIRAVAAVVAFALIALARQVLLFQGEPAASTPVASVMVFATAIVLAGVAGYGARDFVRARDEVRRLRGR